MKCHIFALKSSRVGIWVIDNLCCTRGLELEQPPIISSRTRQSSCVNQDGPNHFPLPMFQLWAVTIHWGAFWRNVPWSGYNQPNSRKTWSGGGEKERRHKDLYSLLFFLFQLYVNTVFVLNFLKHFLKKYCVCIIRPPFIKIMGWIVPILQWFIFQSNERGFLIFWEVSGPCLSLKKMV